ncbi:MAG: protein serine/threonine phosphatase [Crocinitomicaceae bacterium]|jgi:serine phosphatase RsbU (regulator of sigma subunit)|nr:protein serine/threonine phosphatase [Crocinitomicaceae bacterium]
MKRSIHCFLLYKIRLLFLFGLLVLANNTYSQKFADKKFYLLDSLDLEGVEKVEIGLLKVNLEKYHQTKSFPEKITYLAVISETSQENLIWPRYNSLIISLCEKWLENKDNKKGRKIVSKYYADALNNAGFFVNGQGNNKMAVYYYNKSLPVYREIGDQAGIALYYNNLGSVSHSRGNVPKALKYYFKGLRIADKANEPEAMATIYGNIGVAFDEQQDYEQALVYYDKSLKIQEEINDKIGMATTYNNIGFINSKLDRKEKAIEYYEMSRRYYESEGDKIGVATALGNIGKVYFETGETEKALQYSKESLALDLEANNKDGIAMGYIHIADLYLRSRDLAEAEIYGLKALKIGEEIDSPEHKESAYGVLRDIYKAWGKWDKAYEMQTLFFSMRDKVLNQNNHKEALTQGLTHEFEKERVKAQEEHEKKMAISRQEKEKQRLILYFALGILVFVIIFLGLIVNRFRVTQKQKAIIEDQKHLVEEKNREITDSITYAKRIQSAILPQPKLVREYFKDSFILYKPKDIVAGDFYWFEVIGDMVFFAAADCTGHGVPGAMVSVVCHNALNRSVKEFSLKKPSDILDKTREIVIAEFEKSDEDVKDGMDISLCAMKLDGNLLQWSGAHNPLWIIRENQVIEYKADKQPIGKYAYAQAFTNHEIELMPGDEIYISTDGFQDQFGGPKGKKFKASQMKELLLSLGEKAMDEKKGHIDSVFENWKQELEQVDDVCVIGVRI